MILTLPDDILIACLAECPVQGLISLSRVCRKLRSLAQSRLRSVIQNLAPHQASTSPLDLVHAALFVTRIADRWANWQASVFDLTTPFKKKCLPRIALHGSSGQLLCASGSTLHVIDVGSRRPRLVSKKAVGLSRVDDITSISPLANSLDCITTHVSGLIQRLHLSGQVVKSVARYTHRHACIQDSSVRETLLVTASKYKASLGLVSLYNVQSPWQEAHTMTIPGTLWSCHLSDHQLFIGHSGLKHSPLASLSMYNLKDGLPVESTYLGGNEQRSAVYAVTQPLQSPHTTFAGFYDGAVRMYDTREASYSKEGKLWLDPLRSFADRWSEDPVFSLAIGGPSDRHCYVGGARHSQIRIFDLRSKTTPITVYTTRDSSPIFGLQAEFGRVFGATDSRGFMLDATSICDGYKPAYYTHDLAMSISKFI